jgi:hypothetical protein
MSRTCACLATDRRRAFDVASRTLLEHCGQLFVAELHLPTELAWPLERRIHIVVVGPEPLDIRITPRGARR